MRLLKDPKYVLFETKGGAGGMDLRVQGVPLRAAKSTNAGLSFWTCRTHVYHHAPEVLGRFAWTVATFLGTSTRGASSISSRVFIGTRVTVAPVQECISSALLAG